MNLNENYSELIKREENIKNEYKNQNDLRGLVELYTSIERGSIITIGENFCKICYLAGRINDTSIIENFTSKKSGLVDMVPYEYINLSKLLFRIGLIFPNIPNNDCLLIEDYYTKQKYVDLIDDILFDAYLLPRQLKRFDKELLNVKHLEFSSELIDEVFEQALYNAKIQYLDYEEFYYYDKVNNTVKKMSSEDRVIGIHYQILFPRTYIDFSNAIDKFFSEQIRKDFYTKHMNDIFSPGLTYDLIKSSHFNLVYYNLFVEFMEDSIDKYNIDKSRLRELKKFLTLEWLNKVNN